MAFSIVFRSNTTNLYRAQRPRSVVCVLYTSEMGIFGSEQ
jgi:hypothetical protein